MTDDAQRSRIIAAIHGTAAFLVENADVPIPNLITFRHHLHHGSNQDRLALLERFATTHNAERRTIDAPETGGRYEYADVQIKVPGAEVVYTLQTHIVGPCANGCSNPDAHAEGGHDV